MNFACFSGEVSSNIEIMNSESKNIITSKDNILQKYTEYIEANTELMQDWIGDLATVYSCYSMTMNSTIKSAIGTTETMGTNVNTFINSSVDLNLLTDIYAGGK